MAPAVSLFLTIAAAGILSLFLAVLANIAIIGAVVDRPDRPIGK
jgi:hypothetical protein